MPSSGLGENAVVSWMRRLVARLMPFMPLMRGLAFVAAIGIVGVMAYRARSTVNLDELKLWPMAAAVPATMIWWFLLARGWSLLVTGKSRRGDVAHWCRTQAI